MIRVMSDVIDLAKERARRTEPQPDPEHVYVDEHGVTWLRFTCRYSDDHDEFVFEVWATDHADAARRVALIGANGRVDGQVFETRWVPL